MRRETTEHIVDSLPPAPVTEDDLQLTAEFDRETLSRRLAFIMLVRVILFTLILGGTVAVNLGWGNPDHLGGPYITFLFIFIAGLYVLNIVYAVLFRLFTNLTKLAYIQLGGDLLVAGILVNFTGGADSVFVLLFMFSPIAAAVTLTRRAAVTTAGIGTFFLVLVIVLGYARLLPTLPGQDRLPWEAMRSAIGTGLLINGAAMFAVAFLSGYLAEQLKAAARTMEVQQAQIYDLAALNADIIRSLTSGLITVGEEGRILTFNRTAADILGVSQDEQRWKHLEDLSTEIATFSASARGAHRGEVTIDIGGSPRLLYCAVSPLNDRHNLVRGKIINCQDITVQRRMEKRVKRNKRMASLGRMAAGIAHEIRNPLASISGSLEMLRSGPGMDAEDKKLMGIALKEIDRLDGLISELLEYARPHELELRPYDLSKEIHFLASHISELMAGEDSPTLEVDVMNEGLWINADVDQLKGLLWNLVRNAREAGERERVAITVGLLDEKQVFMSVEDSAAGIPREKLSHIFEPFFTTKDSGTGLGLAAVHRIVQAHSATIEVNSSEDIGTTVRIVFPCADRDRRRTGEMVDWPAEPTPL